MTKRRAGKAPEGSGVPVGTEYHWYILAHQHVRKLDANSYSTTLTGLKYKLAHKRFDKEKWNISDAAQRKRLVKILREILTGLEKDWVDSKTEIVESSKPINVKKIPAPAKKQPSKAKRNLARKSK